MNSFNRWWSRNRGILLIGGLSVITIATLGTLKLLPVRELYRLLSQPFQSNPAKLETLVNAQTLGLQQRVDALEKQNQVLETLLKQPTTQKTEGVAAQVIGRSPDQWWQYVYLNQGRQRGIVPDAIVESVGGLAGRVVQASPNTSQVLLISDPESRLAVLLSRSRSVGILQGDRQNHGTLEFFDQDPNVKIGDTVVTSPLSCLFPPNIPVGIVKSIDRSRKTALQARVEFTVPLGRIEWVKAYQYEKTKKTAAAKATTCP